ncbi:MAG: hypothetical protein L6R48_17715 [Planctomycetes bacterium]|nr:hypothetical protein [Planctomycetota bacterium]
MRARDLLAAGDRSAALIVLESAAERPEAAAWLGELVQAEQPERSRALLGTAAAGGHPRAQYLLGLAWAHGAGGARDLGEAARWCRAAAEQGLAAAQFNLALLLAESGDAAEAARWWRLAAINGVAEADGCLDLLYREATADGVRPRTWDEADTRASVALARTDPEAPKTLRFAEYYVDPCIDLVAGRYRLSRDECEDIVQQFMLELEEPLAKGEHRGLAWKESLRRRYQGGRGAFRPYLARVLDNFARDWLRERARRPDPAGGRPEAPDPLVEVLRHEPAWRAALARFATEAGAANDDAARACAVLIAILADQEGQVALGVRLGLGERSVRRCWRLAVELLLEWLEDRCAALPAEQGLGAAAARGLALLPEWLHHPGPEKRARALLLITLVWRQAGEPG